MGGVLYVMYMEIKNINEHCGEYWALRWALVTENTLPARALLKSILTKCVYFKITPSKPKVLGEVKFFPSQELEI